MIKYQALHNDPSPYFQLVNAIALAIQNRPGGGEVGRQAGESAAKSSDYDDISKKFHHVTSSLLLVHS